MLGEALLKVFVSAVAPPLAIAAAGYLFGRCRRIDVEPLSAVTIYLLLPALVFHSLVTMPISGNTALLLVGVMVGFTVVMAIIAAAVGRFAGETGSVLSSATLIAAFPNTGNFGIPVATFAFGAVGRTTAVLFVLVQTVLIYTGGVYLLSKSGNGTARATAFKRILMLPATYAVLVAGVMLAVDAVPPADGTAMRTIQMLSDATIPMFLIILGVQLANMAPKQTVRRVAPTVGVKLFGAPLVAAIIALAVGIGTRTAGQAFVVLAASPAAVTPLVLTIEFTEDSTNELSPADYVGTVILVTLFGSLPLVSGLLLLFELGV